MDFLRASIGTDQAAYQIQIYEESDTGNREKGKVCFCTKLLDDKESSPLSASLQTKCQRRDSMKNYLQLFFLRCAFSCA